MKTPILLLTIVGLLSFNSCKEKNADEAEMNNTVETENVNADMETSSEVDPETLTVFDLKRNEIEDFSKTAEAISLETSTMREKIKQKWSKIHYYMKDGNVVRIKTYPHESISKRTEEFYFDNGNLFAAVVEDNGEKEAGNGEMINKIYYFENGKFLGEKNTSGEMEYNEKNSDGEELMVEAKEYLEVYNNSKK